MIELNNKHVLVVGLGRSGLAAAELCLRQGAILTLNDSRSFNRLEQSLLSFSKRVEIPLNSDRIKLVLEDHPPKLFTSVDLIVLSPGVPPLEALDAADNAKIPIIGEMELGYQFLSSTLIAITGTNGKSTTTSLCGALFKASGFKTFTGGNLGEPLCEALNRRAEGLSEGDITVLEVSSFQLERIKDFHPNIAMLINLSEDHLDRYSSYEDYVQAKGQLFINQNENNWAIVNADPDQHRCRVLAANGKGRLITFRSIKSRGTGAWIEDNGDLCLRLPHQKEERYPRSLLRLPGKHNSQNALAALLAARLGGASHAGCKAALATFEGLPHRMQEVGTHNNVVYYNDSKATNVGSVVGSLNGFEKKVVLIAGGKDKGGDYGPLRPVLQEVCRHLILIGAATEVMNDALKGTVPISHASSMKDAVNLAANTAQPNDAVVLSPACSSYDMYNDYIERGNDFAKAVRDLIPS